MFKLDRVASIAIAVLLFSALFWRLMDVALLICIVTLVFSNGVRSVVAISAIFLYAIAFTPYSLPTYWISLASMICLWGGKFTTCSLIRCGVESMAVGFAMCWLITGFFHSTITMWSFIIRGAGCVAFSSQFVAIAVAIHSLRQLSITAAALPIAIVATLTELIQAWLGLTWAVTNPILAIATTPLAQWSNTFTPFGLTFVSYFLGFLLVPDFAECEFKRWQGPLIGATCLAILWIGGIVIESRVHVQSLGFSAMLVQPHFQFKPNEAWQPWKTLHQLTMESLKSDGKVDLIVWPESSLSESWYEPPTKQESTYPERLTLQDFKANLLPQYCTNCMFGVTIADPTSIMKYGLEVPHLNRYNCGCLVSRTAEIDCHEKIQLVPLREGLPNWLRFDFVRNTILPYFQLTAPFSSGRNFHLLSFSDQQGTLHTIAAAVCYESWHPWLPQFRKDERVEAIVYVMYDGDFADYPELFQRQLLSVRMRAIETRTWNLVCSSWRGTAIIDPRGRIVKQLPAIAGVLRSDHLESK